MWVGRSDDEQVHVLERRQGLVHRDEIDLPLLLPAHAAISSAIRRVFPNHDS